MKNAIDRDKFWASIEARCTQRNLQLKDIQNMIGSGGTYIYVAKCNKAIPSLDVLWGMADVFECSLDELVGREFNAPSAKDELTSLLRQSPALRDVLERLQREDSK